MVWKDNKTCSPDMVHMLPVEKLFFTIYSIVKYEFFFAGNMNAWMNAVKAMAQAMLLEDFHSWHENEQNQEEYKYRIK